MEVLIDTPKNNFIIIQCEETETINEVKNKINKKLSIPTNDQVLIHNGNILNDTLKLKDYKIHKGSMISVSKKQYGGIILAKSPPPTVGDISVKYDGDFLIPGELNSIIIRNSNTAPSFCQHKSDCYAYAASEVYHNVAQRIYGAMEIPSVRECFGTARYSLNGGQVTESLKRLEDEYHLGILWEKVDEITPRDSIALSVVACFSTSQQGWVNVSNGDFLTFAEGSENDSHAILIEGYNRDLDCYYCKNSWGNKTATQYINFSEYAAHSCYFIKVYFTLDSIKGKTTKIYNPKIGPKYIGELKGHKITCRNMDKIAATFETNYICEYHQELEGDLKYIGYDIDEWIEIILNREKGQPFPNSYYYNLTKKRIWNELFNLVHNPLTIKQINKEVLRETQFSQARQKVKDKNYKFPIIKRRKRGKFELNPHIGGTFSNRIFRKTNLKNTFIQYGDCSYAYSAAYTYIETASRIYGIKYIPKFDECLRIAAYNGDNEGDAIKSIELLEKHFKLGIRCEESEYISPEEALKISIIAKIETSYKGYCDIDKGEFLTYKGNANYRPEWAIIIGVDTDIDCFICRKTWDIFQSKGLFNLGMNASHCNKYIKVYYFLDDIIHKAIKKYKPRLLEFIGELDGYKIKCARMNEDAAKYETDYDYVFHPEIEGDLKYIGYNIDDLIKIKLKRPENQEFSLHYYINLNKREQYKYHSENQNRKNNVKTMQNLLKKNLQKIHNRNRMSINPLYNIL